MNNIIRLFLNKDECKSIFRGIRLKFLVTMFVCLVFTMHAHANDDLLTSTEESVQEYIATVEAQASLKLNYDIPEFETPTQKRIKSGIFTAADSYLLESLAPYKLDYSNIQRSGDSPIERFSNNKTLEIDSNAYMFELLKTASLTAARSLMGSSGTGVNIVSFGMLADEKGDIAYNVMFRPINNLMFVMAVNTNTYFEDSRFEINLLPSERSVLKLIATDNDTKTEAGVQFQLTF